MDSSRTTLRWNLSCARVVVLKIIAAIGRAVTSSCNTVQNTVRPNEVTVNSGYCWEDSKLGLNAGLGVIIPGPCSSRNRIFPSLPLCQRAATHSKR